MTHTHKTTRILFWAAFGAFLAVSIPHIAWVFRQYEPRTDASAFNLAWWALAFGFAIAIDAVTAWLSFIESQGSEQGGQLVAWLFIAMLALMSWYFNWIFSLAHDPAHPGANVWDYSIIDAWWIVPQMTIGWLTPLIISAMPVFVIAYTFVLNKVATMKAQAAKSLEELQREANEAQARAEAERRIRDARRGQNGLEKSLQLGKGLISAAHELGTEIEKQKRDPQREQLEKVIAFFRATPEMLTDENSTIADTMIADMLKLKKAELAHAWRIKASQELACEMERTRTIEDGNSLQDLDETRTNEPLPDTINDADTLKSKWAETGQEEQERWDDDMQSFITSSDTDGESEEREAENIEEANGTSELRLSDENRVSSRSGGRRYVTFDDASTMTGYAVDTLKRKAKAGEIRRHPTDGSRVLLSSLQGVRNPRQAEKERILEPVS